MGKRSSILQLNFVVVSPIIIRHVGSQGVPYLDISASQKFGVIPWKALPFTNIPPGLRIMLYREVDKKRYA